jgi:hypothetical protein
VYARQKRAQLSAERRLALGKHRENTSDAVDRQLAKIAISALGNPDETGLAACRDLPRYEAEPRGETSPSREGPALVGDPVGLLAGGVFGYTGGPSIASSWGLKHGHHHRHYARASAHPNHW